VGSGLHLPQPKVLGDLIDDFLFLDESEDSLLTLAFWTGEGVNLISGKIEWKPTN
jgi:hypothetical protein